jgi:hypothetical protein
MLGKRAEDFCRVICVVILEHSSGGTIVSESDLPRIKL